MKVIGLTGGIASGKSSVAHILEKCGAVVVDADLLAREVVAPGEPAYHAIVEAFGKTVVRPDGTLDRAALGKLVFADVSARKVLEEITHPRIAERAARRIEDERLRGTKVLFYIVPLLIEAGLASTVDAIWLVMVDKEVQINRLMTRDAISRDEALRKISTQMPLQEKAAYADVIIDNNGLPDETARCVTNEWERLLVRISTSGC
ncbi:MAG: dephospho-CoA kinase [Geobacter sp.]|nr:MAG: dephospho-CoA kinase [Geobacter sp.]